MTPRLLNREIKKGRIFYTPHTFNIILKARSRNGFVECQTKETGWLWHGNVRESGNEKLIQLWPEKPPNPLDRWA